MTPAVAPRRMKTPPQVAEELAVDPEKIIGFIRSGELIAIDIATSGSRRPRWRIDPEDLAAFLARRRSTPPAPKPTRRRRSSATVKDFFPDL